jgi:Tol biopolymer transport system component
LTFAGQGAYSPAISRDGRRLAYSMLLQDWNIWSLPIDAAGHVEGQPSKAFSSTKDELCPAFSPDGHWVAFESNRSGYSEIYRCAVDGTRCGP